MSRGFSIEKSGIIYSVDFGYKDDFAVELISQISKDGSIIVISCRTIGRAKDFTDAKIDKYKKTMITEPEVKLAKLKKGDCFMYNRFPYIVKYIYWEDLGMLKRKVYICR